MVHTGVQSLEEQIDAMFHTLASWLSAWIPFSWVQHGLAWYVAILETLKWLRSQTSTTVRAIRQSFQTPDILFFDYGGYYVPVLRYDAYSSLLTGRPSWAYIKDTQSFYNVNVATTHTTKTFSIPFIGAVLHYRSPTNVWNEDITEWMSNQRIVSINEEIPLQVLVLKWAHDTGSSVLNTFEGYTITLVTLDGEEMTCDVATEEILPSASGGTEESETKGADQEVVEEETEHSEDSDEQEEETAEGDEENGTPPEEEDATQNVPTEEGSSESVQDA